jgi:hypothetical protein
MRKYGVQNVSQSPEIFEKILLNSYRRKIFTCPNGKVLTVQGYKDIALHHIFMKYPKLEDGDVITSRKDVPDIIYKGFDGKMHRYYVDIYIPKMNLCIEVKSPWTLSQTKDLQLRRDAVIDQGYDFEIQVFDRKGLLSHLSSVFNRNTYNIDIS